MFKLDFKVRDYECDLQGIVNNSTYQSYLEHARHEFLLEKGIDFAEYHKQGKTLVVVKAELEYKTPLTPGDSFYVNVEVAKEGRLKFIFLQNIYRKEDDKLVVKGKVTGVCLINGRPAVDEAMDAFLISE